MAPFVVSSRYSPEGRRCSLLTGVFSKILAPALFRPGDQGVDGVDRAELPISGNEQAAGDNTLIERGVDVLDFPGRNDVSIDAETPGETGAPFHFVNAILVAPDGQGAILLETRCHAGIGFELGVEPYVVSGDIRRGMASRESA